MKRVIIFTLIITIIFWAFAPLSLVSADNYLLTLTPQIGYKSPSATSSGTGRVVYGSRSITYQAINPAKPSGWVSSYSIPYYYSNDISVSGSGFNIANSLFSIGLTTSTFTLPDHYGDNIIHISTQVLSYGQAPTFNFYGYYGDYDDSFVIASVNVSTKLGDYIYTDDVYGAYTYSLYKIDVLIDVSDVPTSYTGYDLMGDYGTYSVTKYGFASTTYHYLFPNYTIDNTLGGLGFNQANTSRYYNTYKLYYKPVTVDFEYSANYQDAAYKMQHEIKSAVSAAGQQVTDKLTEIYGDVDPEVIEYFEEAVADVEDFGESGAAVESEFYAEASEAVASIAEFSADPDIMAAMNYFGDLSGEIWGGWFVNFAVVFACGIAFVSFIIFGKVR